MSLSLEEMGMFAVCFYGILSAWERTYRWQYLSYKVICRCLLVDDLYWPYARKFWTKFTNKVFCCGVMIRGAHDWLTCLGYSIWMYMGGGGGGGGGGGTPTISERLPPPMIFFLVNPQFFHLDPLPPWFLIGERSTPPPSHVHSNGIALSRPMTSQDYLSGNIT